MIGRFAPNRGADGMMNRSKNAHSSSDIRFRAKLVFIADTSLNHDQTTVGIPFVNTA